jgi:phosphoribosyl 1,2-cyclic phosphodiesterase
LIPLLRRKSEGSDVPVYLSSLTASSIAWGEYTPNIRTFHAGERFSIGDFHIETFTVPHDAIDPVGFCVRAGGIRVGVVTDLGYMPESVKFHVRDADLLILESNHDLDMLKVGPYPWSVKQRVMGRNGHLSNEIVSDYILHGLTMSVRTLVLGHLSEHNNHPAIAHMCATHALSRRAHGARLVVVEPGVQSEVFAW